MSQTLKLTVAIAAVALSIGLAGCRHIPVGYDIEVQQGNIISQENIQQLKLGMTREQVIEIMGEPVVINTFDTRCWDYVYTKVSRKQAFTRSKVTLIFENDRLTKIIN